MEWRMSGKSFPFGRRFLANHASVLQHIIIIVIKVKQMRQARRAVEQKSAPGKTKGRILTT
jgi:hypothetical protein